MNHKEFRGKLSEYVDKKLGAGELAAFESHLKECKDCALELKLTQKAVKELKNIGSKEMELPQNFYARLGRKLDAADEKKRSFVWNPYVRAFAAGFGVIVIAFFVRQLVRTPEYKSATGYADEAKYTAETQEKEKAMDKKISELSNETDQPKKSVKKKAMKVSKIIETKKEDIVSGGAMKAEAYTAVKPISALPAPAGNADMTEQGNKSLGESMAVEEEPAGAPSMDSNVPPPSAAAAAEMKAPQEQSRAVYKSKAVEKQPVITREQAIDIAEKAWMKAFGYVQKDMDGFKPYVIIFQDGNWNIKSSAAGPEIVIVGSTGEILKIINVK
jgi:cytoskeletal protein RodZ